MEINKKVSELRHLKEKILELELNINVLKQINSKNCFEYAKIKIKELKDLKIKFQQVQQELHELLDKEMKL
jgi:hypothetical protein